MYLTLSIFGSPEQEQTVTVELYSVEKWLDGRYVTFIHECKILELLQFHPSDIHTDLAIGIAEALGENPNDVRIDCEVEYSVKPQ